MKEDERRRVNRWRVDSSEEHCIEWYKQEEKTEQKREEARTISRRGRLGLSSEELQNINYDVEKEKLRQAAWQMGKGGAQTDEMERS